MTVTVLVTIVVTGVVSSATHGATTSAALRLAVDSVALLLLGYVTVLYFRRSLRRSTETSATPAAEREQSSADDQARNEAVSSEQTVESPWRILLWLHVLIAFSVAGGVFITLALSDALPWWVLLGGVAAYGVLLLIARRYGAALRASVYPRRRDDAAAD